MGKWRIGNGNARMVVEARDAAHAIDLFLEAHPEEKLNTFFAEPVKEDHGNATRTTNPGVRGSS